MSGLPGLQRKRKTYTERRQEIRTLTRRLLKKKYRGDGLPWWHLYYDVSIAGLTKTQRKLAARREATLRVGR